MTHRLDVAFSPALAARWCALAEKRLDHLTELFESGRWRRYYSEYSFLENIQEAKLAVKNWRALSVGESIAPRRTGFTLTVADGRPMLDPPSDDSTEQDDAIEQPIMLAPTIHRVFAQSGIMVPEEIPVAEEIVAPDVAPLAPRIDMAALEAALSIGIRADMSPPPIFDLDAIERRYPALRHAL